MEYNQYQFHKVNQETFFDIALAFIEINPEWELHMSKDGYDVRLRNCRLDVQILQSIVAASIEDYEGQHKPYALKYDLRNKVMTVNAEEVQRCLGSDGLVLAQRFKTTVMAPMAVKVRVEQACRKLEV